MNTLQQCLKRMHLILCSLKSKKIQRVVLSGCLSLSMLLLPVQAETAAEPDLHGAWVGTLQVGSSQLRLRFNISREQDQQYSATMDSIDQGASGIPVSRVSVKQQHIELEIQAAQAVYLGEYQQASEQIQGKWQQGGQAFDLILSRQQQQERKPQDPVKPYPYIEEQISFNNAAAGIQLAGTLTRPANTLHPVPAVVLISGSGPQDRDQQLLGHRPFLVMADYLTRQGFAVLRFDDRGIGKSGGTFFQATSLDFASDVGAAVRYLQQRTEVRADQIGLIGHSEGGLIAPVVAQQQAGVSFLVLLAAPGVTGAEVSANQFERMLVAQGLTETTVRHATTIYTNMNKLAARPEAPTAAELKAYYQTQWQALPEEIKQQLLPLGGGALSAERLAELQNAWFRYFQQHDPYMWLSKTTLPTLVLYGSKDRQLDAEINLTAIEHALQAAKNNQYKLLRLPGLNHLFQEANTGRWDEYANIKQTLSPTLLSNLADWLLQVTSSNASEHR
ncbi:MULTISPECIES: alpha/beta fold hydrolase [Rheinheimera]|uniref:alpha/beta hydrolase family protein n=1 Tax=Rheinheimera TaxID=67575 RepID=UPI000E880C39|nr:alpha/beta hydrolase [Rheinheimera sp.]